MPGVLQIEAMAQLGGLAMLDPEDQAAKQQVGGGGGAGAQAAPAHGLVVGGTGGSGVTTAQQPMSLQPLEHS